MSGLAIARVLDRGPAAAQRAQAGPPAHQPGEAEGFGTVVLPRHGMRPLRITARLLAEIATRADELPIWSEIAVYEVAATEADTPCFAATIVHRLRLLGPPDLAFAELLPDAEAALRFFRCHDPVAAVPTAAFIGEAGARDAERGVGRSGAELAQAIIRHRAAWRELLSAMFGRER